MSKYTTEVRFICENASGLTESKGYTDIDSILTSALPKIFSFDFPIFDESYRSVLEKKILKHFYTREICEETVGLWKLRLDTRLNEIMPYYNKLYKSELLEFNPLYTINTNKTGNNNLDKNENVTENIKDKATSERDISVNTNGTTKNTGKVISESTASGTNNTTSSGSADGSDLYSDTPQGSLTGVSSETYLTNARKTSDTTSGTNNVTTSDSNNGTVDSTDDTTINTTDITNDDSTNNYNRDRTNANKVNSTEDYLENVVGFSGTSGSELLLKYRETFLNIDMMIIQDLEPLFFQLW